MSIDESEGVVVALVTGPNEAIMTSIAETVVGEGLAACVNLMPGVRSVYRWLNNVETSQEVLGIMKTTRSAVSDLQRRVLDLHPYDTPEFIVLPVESGSPSYLDWIADSISAEGNA